MVFTQMAFVHKVDDIHSSAQKEPLNLSHDNGYMMCLGKKTRINRTQQQVVQMSQLQSLTSNRLQRIVALRPADFLVFYMVTLPFYLVSLFVSYGPPYLFIWNPDIRVQHQQSCATLVIGSSPSSRVQPQQGHWDIRENQPAMWNSLSFTRKGKANRHRSHTANVSPPNPTVSHLFKMTLQTRPQSF